MYSHTSVNQPARPGDATRVLAQPLSRRRRVRPDRARAVLFSPVLVSAVDRQLEGRHCSDVVERTMASRNAARRGPLALPRCALISCGSTRTPQGRRKTELHSDRNEITERRKLVLPVDQVCPTRCVHYEGRLPRRSGRPCARSPSVPKTTSSACSSSPDRHAGAFFLRVSTHRLAAGRDAAGRGSCLFLATRALRSIRAMHLGQDPPGVERAVIRSSALLVGMRSGPLGPDAPMARNAVT